MYSVLHHPLLCANTPSLPCSFSALHHIPSAFFRGLSTSACIVLMSRSPCPFHRLPPLLQLAKFTPTHVELHASLLFLGNLGRSCAGIRSLAHVSTTTGGLRGGTGETCEECLEEVFGSGECCLHRGVLFFNGIVLGRDSISLLPFRSS